MLRLRSLRVVMILQFATFGQDLSYCLEKNLEHEEYFPFSTFFESAVWNGREGTATGGKRSVRYGTKTTGQHWSHDSRDRLRRLEIPRRSRTATPRNRTRSVPD